MRAVLGLRTLEDNLHGTLVFVHAEGVAKGLVVFGDDLDANVALGNAGDLGVAFLSGPQLPGFADFRHLDVVAPLDEVDDYRGAVDGLAVFVGDVDGDVGLIGGERRRIQ